MIDDSYFRYLTVLMDSVDLPILDLAREVAERIKGGNAIWIVGNGGSASTAEHFETDLSFVRYGKDFPQIKATALTSNSALITAIANDIGFENIFSHQLIRKASKGDVCVLISASGNSQNLLRAVDVCKDLGVTTIGILGFDGGLLAKQVDRLVHVKSDLGRYGPVEDIHLAICHNLSALIFQELVSSEGRQTP